MSDAPAEPSTTAGNSIWIAAMPPTFLVLWSTGFIGAKFGLPYAEPFTFLGYRFVVVTVLMLLVCLAFRAPWPKDLKLAGHIAIAGLLVQGTYLGGVFAAIHHGMSAGLVSLIVGLQPVLTAAIAIPLLKETVSKRQWRTPVWRWCFWWSPRDWSARSVISPLFGWPWWAFGYHPGCALSESSARILISEAARSFQFAASAMHSGPWPLSSKPAWLIGPGSLSLRWAGWFLVLSIGRDLTADAAHQAGCGDKGRQPVLSGAAGDSTCSLFAMFGETLTIAAMIGMGVAVAGVAMVSRG